MILFDFVFDTHTIFCSNSIVFVVSQVEKLLKTSGPNILFFEKVFHVKIKTNSRQNKHM